MSLENQKPQQILTHFKTTRSHKHYTKKNIFFCLIVIMVKLKFYS